MYISNLKIEGKTKFFLQLHNIVATANIKQKQISKVLTIIVGVDMI